MQCPLQSITSYHPNNRQIQSKQISTKFEDPALLCIPGNFPLTQSPIRVPGAEIHPNMMRNPSMLKSEWAKTGEGSSTEQMTKVATKSEIGNSIISKWRNQFKKHKTHLDTKIKSNVCNHC